MTLLRWFHPMFRLIWSWFDSCTKLKGFSRLLFQYLKWVIVRLNSGNFRIFELIYWNSDRNSSNCRASKIIPNDTKLDTISLGLNMRNPFCNICVAVGVRGPDAANFTDISTDAQKNFTSFDTNPNLGAMRQIWFWIETDQKTEITWVEIAWV